jgi:hypothetical protein
MFLGKVIENNQENHDTNEMDEAEEDHAWANGTNGTNKSGGPSSFYIFSIVGLSNILDSVKKKLSRRKKP